MSNFIEELNGEIDRRIAIMESPDYESVPRFGRWDFVPPSIILTLSLILIIISYTRV